jgi:hypothetical protein
MTTARPRLAVCLLATTLLACGNGVGPSTPGNEGGQGGDPGGGGNGGPGGRGGQGGRGGGSAGSAQNGGAGGETGAPSGRGGASGTADAALPADALAADVSPSDLSRSDLPPSDLAPPSDGPAACGLAGKACCGGNTCMGGSRPVLTPGGSTETTVLQLRASGGDPYAYFRAMNLWPIDGPDSGYITDTGMSFLFVLHENGAEETVSSGALRQRNELTVNPGNPMIYKAVKGDTITYAWRFRLERVNAQPTWTDFFQVKQHGTTGTGPYMAFEADKANFNVKTARSGIVRTIPLAAVMGLWIDARVTLTFDDAGPAIVTLKKVDDGTTVLSYSGVLDLWDTTIDFVRPKWGFYRNKAAGAGEAAIHYNDMRIIRHSPGGSCACAP